MEVSILPEGLQILSSARWVGADGLQVLGKQAETQESILHSLFFL